MASFRVDMYCQQETRRMRSRRGRPVQMVSLWEESSQMMAGEREVPGTKFPVLRLGVVRLKWVMGLAP